LEAAFDAACAATSGAMRFADSAAEKILEDV
jgi:hypothetical protein